MLQAALSVFLSHQPQMRLLQLLIEDFNQAKTASSKHSQYNPNANYCVKKTKSMEQSPWEADICSGCQGFPCQL
jgi:hypothetical protein